MPHEWLPTLFSTPHPDGLAEKVLPDYPLSRPVRCELYRSGRNDHYRVHAGDKVYYAKVPGVTHHWRSQDEWAARLVSEMVLLERLHDQGILVPEPVRRHDGKYLTMVNAPEGVRYFMLFHGVQGQPLGDAVSLEQVRDVATLAARLHGCMDLLPDDFTAVQWDLHWLIDASLANLEPLMQHSKADWTCVQDLGKAITDWIRSALPQHKPEYGVIHGDFHQDNILCSATGLSLLDFESFGHGWRVWEIAYYLSGNFSSWIFEPQMEAERLQRRNAFLDAYTVERGLSEAEIASIPVFGTARVLLAIGRLATLNARLAGQIANEQERVDRWMSFLRAWVAYHKPLQ
ncbi:MAG: phosphotransferase [Phycisphaeraceae bacterium]|nr:phosphotransferase [Phycisphaeraceae bacterium]